MLRVYDDVQSVLPSIKKEIDFDFPSDTNFIKIKQGLKIDCQNEKITVSYSTKRDILRAALIIKANGYSNNYTIEENCFFEDVCLMVDCSRNAVRNIDSVKKLIRNIAMMGYNSLMLYTEDTYEVDNEPFFGYLRGRYTKAEMKELSDYADLIGIELIPCIQTLAHLNQLNRYKYSHFNCFDCSDILLVGSDRTYELIENMIKTISECFSSRRINLGMDEAWLLGRGKYLDLNGATSSFEVISSHLNRVCELSKKYGFKPIIWGDMFYNLGQKDSRFTGDDGKVDWKRLAPFVPKNLNLCCWEYHILNSEGYMDKLNNYLQLDSDMWFAGGTSHSNRSFVPHLTYSCKIANAAITAAKKSNVKHLMQTVWGDNGAECSLFAQLPALMHYVYTARDITESRLKDEFMALTGYDMSEFMKIEYAETFCGKFTSDLSNPVKWGLYNDPLNGYVDAIIIPKDKKYFKKAASTISNRVNGQYEYVFKSIYDLNRVLNLKYDLGIRLRNAYKNDDYDELNKCVKDMNKIISRLGEFIKSYRAQWLIENKPNGFEIQEIRLGGLKERLLGCKQRVRDYISGEIKCIPELEETLLKKAIKRVTSDGRCDLFSHESIASVNAFDGYTEVDV